MANDSGIRQIPSWCSGWLYGAPVPFVDWMPECQPYSDAELQQMTATQLAKIKAVNPQLADQGAALADQYQQQAQAADPQGTCELNAAVNHPQLAAMFGAKLVCSIGGGADQGGSSYMPYLVIGAIAAAGVWTFWRVTK